MKGRHQQALTSSQSKEVVNPLWILNAHLNEPRHDDKELLTFGVRMLAAGGTGGRINEKESHDIEGKFEGVEDAEDPVILLEQAS